MVDPGLGTIIIVKCPYCGRHNNFSWRWGEKGPIMKCCGLDEAYDKRLGCLSYFVVRIEWEYDAVGFAIEGEGHEEGGGHGH